MSEPLPYYDARKQGVKHLKTFQKRDRYDGPEDLSNVSPQPATNQDLLFHSDGRKAAVAGDVLSSDSSTVENAAAFLDSEFQGEELEWAYFIEGDEDVYGFVAGYTDTEEPMIVEETGFHQKIVPGTIVHGFEPVQGSDQLDIQVDRYSEHDLLKHSI